jgi:hypothetical protein
MKYAIVALIIVLLLVSLACAESQAIFDRIDGAIPTPAANTCIPECVDLCAQIQEKHGNPPEVCVADCQAVCAEAEVRQ